MYIQIKSEKERVKKIELDSFIKSSKLLLTYASKVIKGCNGILQPMEESHSSRGFQELVSIHGENVQYITSVYEDLITYKKVIDEINDYTIFGDIFDLYIEMKLEIDNILYFTNRFLYHEADVLSPLEGSLAKLNNYTEQFSSYTIELNKK